MSLRTRGALGALLLSAVLVTCAALAATASVATASPRITGGTKVTSDDYHARWGSIVSLELAMDGNPINLASDMPYPNSGGQAAHLCGGTLIAPAVVVTAAHCAEAAEEMEMLGAQIRVVGGTRILSRTQRTQRGVSALVSRYRIHPSYRTGDSSGVQPPFDVAVLTLAAPLTGLPTMPMATPADTPAWGDGRGRAAGAALAGWGMSNPLFLRDMFESDDEGPDDPANDTQYELRTTTIPVLANSRCGSTDGPLGSDANEFDGRSMICAYAKDTNKDPATSSRRGGCHGDSGGPLTVQNARGAWMLIGVVSWGPSTAGGCNRPTVFSRIDPVADWILRVAADDVQPPVLVAPAVTSIAPRSLTTMHVAWSEGRGAPLRYRLLRVMTIRELLGLTGTTMHEVFDNAKDARVPPAIVRRMLAHDLIMDVGSTAADGRDLLVRDIAPTRPGAPRTVRFRLAARDADGRTTYGPIATIAQPIDGRAPRAVRVAPLTSNRTTAPGITWSTAKDNDCVASYDVQLRGTRAGAKWHTIDDESGPCHLGVGTTVVDDLVDRDWSRLGVLPAFTPRAAAPTTTHEFEKRNFYRAWDTRPGTYLLRVVVRDRAGNTTPSRAVRVVVARELSEPIGNNKCRPVGTSVICRFSFKD